MRQTVVLDSSQISTWLECHEKHRLESVEHLVHINERDPADSNRPNDAIAAGSLGHKYLEIYYNNLGLQIENAAVQTLSFDPDAADFQDNHEFPLDTAVRATVRQRFKDYVMFYANRDFQPCGRRQIYIKVENGCLKDGWKQVPLVEQGFSYPLLDTSEYLFVLEGRIDLISQLQSETVWVDHKFQLRERELYAKSIQFRNYSLATNLDIGIINYVRLHKVLGDKTFIRQPICFSGLERRLWKEELTQIFVDFARAQAAGRRELNRQACPGKFGYKCEFTPLCEQANMETYEAIRRQQFTKRREWKPW